MLSRFCFNLIIHHLTYLVNRLFDFCNIAQIQDAIIYRFTNNKIVWILLLVRKIITKRNNKHIVYRRAFNKIVSRFDSSVDPVIA